MRLKTTIVLIAIAVYFTPGLNAQAITEITVKNAIELLKEKTGYSFVFEASDLNTQKLVSVDFDNSTLDQIIGQIIKDQGLSYEISGTNIIVKKLPTVPSRNEIQRDPSNRWPKVTGLIQDEKGQPVIGAQIQLANTTIGYLSGLEGRFEIEAPSDGILIVSFLGYQKTEVAIRGRRILEITLKEEVQALDEVVIIGYGAVKKRDLTGAVSSVKAKDLPKSVNPSVGHMLAGKAAGLQVSQNSAQPGGGLTFNIRGYGSTSGNSPLIVIDGFPVSGNGIDPQASDIYDSGIRETNLNSINPDDIESIEVLKDASATAIYGARAGHGVILITTKRGQEGDIRIQYSNAFSVQKMINRPTVLNGQEFMEVANSVLYEQWLANNNIYPFGSRSESEVISRFVPRYSRQEIENIGKGTDWMDLISRNGFTSQHNISLTGGTKKLKYLVSANYFSQQGLVKKNDMNRFTSRINLDFEVNKWVTVGTSLNISYIKNKNAALGTGANEHSGVLRAAQQFNPTLSVFDNEGQYSLDPLRLTHPNPVSMLELINNSSNERLLDNTYIEVTPIENLKIRGTIGLDRQIGQGQFYANRNTYDGKQTGGRAAQDLSKHFSWQYELTASYTKEINDHTFSALIGTSFQKFKYDGFRGLNSVFTTDSYLYNNMGAGEGVPTVGSWATSKEMGSYFGRLNYTYKDKYLFTATLRTDGSSDFAKNHKWGHFPSVAFAWRLSEEKFMQKFDWLSNAKIRISYGQTGNDGIGNRAKNTYGLEQSGINYYYMFNNRFQNGIGPLQMGNDNLRWETTTETNLGFDIGFLKNRLSLTIEMFSRVTSDLLSTNSLPYYFTINSFADNIGSTKSRGFELTLNAQIFNNKDFQWTSDIIFSIYSDKWKERSANWVPAAYEIYHANLTSHYGYLNGGIIRSMDEIPAHMPNAKPGMIIVKDINGYVYDDNGNQMFDPKSGKPLLSGEPDGILNDADMVLLYDNKPWQLGFTNTFRYKNFDLNVYCVGMFDRKGYNPLHTNFLWQTSNIVNGQNTVTEAKNRWSPENPNGKYPSALNNPYPWHYSDYGIEDMSFFRIKNITLGYTIPINKKLARNFRVYVDVQNVYTFTKYSGQDPETDVYGGSPYPNCRSFSCGLNITF